MNKQSVLIFKLPELFKILNELKDHLDFNIFNFTEKQELLNLNKSKYENYLVLTDLQNQIKDEKFQKNLKISKIFKGKFGDIILVLRRILLKHTFTD